MNQILDTGDKQVTGRETKRVPEKVYQPKQPKKVLPINGIVLFFAIAIIILGICIIVGSIYSKQKINEQVEANMRPEIMVERNDEDNTLQIIVTHIRKIKTVTYRWNDEEETVIDGKDTNNITQTIDLIGGENTLNISVLEENGQVRTFEKTFIAGNIPEIKLEAVANGVKVIVTSEEGINYIQYSWDDGEVQKVEVGDKQYEGIINTPKGEHILKIEVVDINDMKAEKEQKVVGDTEPTLDIKSKLINGKATYVINAEDDENIKTITIIHNGGEAQVIEVNEKTYYGEVIMTEGEENTIIVTVTNKNNLQKTRGVRFTNK